MQMPVKIDETVARHLPNRQSVARADSLEEAREVVSRNIYPHRLQVAPITGPSLMCITSALNLGDCALGYVQYGYDVTIQSGIISEYLLVKSTVGGHGRVTCGEQTVITTPRSIIMTSMTERTNVFMTSQCRHLTTRVCREALETRIEEKLGRKLTEPLQFGLEVASDSDFGRGWHQLLAHICDLSASAPSVLASEDVRRQYSRTMIEMLVHSAPHNYSTALEESVTQPVPWHVRRARDYVHNHIADIRSVADIAASIGITTRTLQSGFRKAFNMTPAEYIRRTRVEALHQALLNAAAGESVTDLMQAVGIVNFGRYAHYYRQQIGVVPSVTRKRNM
ncbi:MAG TPA: AraC family transcriptional regulator [Steroidobacteraceae bacterium]|nr:AraC family transcriptional regulator [Steroidobacteraceae bacterium]